MLRSTSENHCHLTACRCIKKCILNLCYARRNPNINPMERCCRVLRWSDRLWSDESACWSLFWGENTDIRHWVFQTSVSSHRMGDVHMCEGTAEAYIWTVQKHLLPWKWHLFPGNLWSLEWDTARPPSARATTAWLIDTERMCLTGLPAVQISLLLKISGVLWKGEWDNKYLGLLKLVKSCIKRD